MTKYYTVCSYTVCFCTVFFVFNLAEIQAEQLEKEDFAMKLEVTSNAFEEGALIPEKYTCDGPDVSPPLAWTSPPEGTGCFVLICDDPDAPVGTWVHWVLYGVSPETLKLPEGIPATGEVLNGAKQGTNDFRRIGYGGPCPPGGTHRYYFTLYAVGSNLDLAAGATKADVLSTIKDDILAEGQLMGRYHR
ncbi:MAG: YbhB/YbcL family Raf kinase inhibitor-like protein [Candidatus Scalindua sp.]|nr:YbhB/YbcL family Raf kinase inhibitor-like protein [Candidatus Scalindua sp.]